jgi:hypothetical protein
MFKTSSSGYGFEKDMETKYGFYCPLLREAQFPVHCKVEIHCLFRVTIATEKIIKLLTKNICFFLYK